MVNPAMLISAQQPASSPSQDERLPDSSRPFGPCPRCNRHSSFTLQHSWPVTFDHRRKIVGVSQAEPVVNERAALLGCQGCRQGVVVVEERCLNGVPVRKGAKSGTESWSGIHWWPMPGTQRGSDDVPVAIADAVAEGYRCLAAQAPRAAVVMFRSALALIVDERASETAKAKKSLYAQLKQMAQDKDLDAALGDFADHIRVVGNAGAHPSTLDPVAMDEAAELAEFISHMLAYLYIMPAKVQRSRARRS
jgi:hypothetical protein